MQSVHTYMYVSTNGSFNHEHRNVHTKAYLGGGIECQSQGISYVDVNFIYFGWIKGRFF